MIFKKLFFVIALCGIAAPAHGMPRPRPDPSKARSFSDDIAKKSVGDAVDSILALWDWCTGYSWWTDFEASIAKGDLEETTKLLHSGSVWGRLKISIEERRWGLYNKIDTYSKFAGTVVSLSLRLRLPEEKEKFEEIVKIMNLLFAYNRIDFSDANVSYDIMHNAILYYNLDFIKYLYDHGIKNIWMPDGALLKNPIDTVCKLNSYNNLGLFEFFLERLPQNFEVGLLTGTLKARSDSFYQLMLDTKNSGNTKSLKLVLERAVRNNMVGGYAACIMQLKDATYKQEMLDLIKETIKHEYNNVHFQNDLQSMLVVARENQQYSDIAFQFSE